MTNLFSVIIFLWHGTSSLSLRKHKTSLKQTTKDIKLCLNIKFLHEKSLCLPTKQIVKDDKASGRSMSAGSTSEFGQESLTKIIEVFLIAWEMKREKEIVIRFFSSANRNFFQAFIFIELFCEAISFVINLMLFKFSKFAGRTEGGKKEMTFPSNAFKWGKKI